MTIFEIKDVNQGVFQDPKRAKNGNFEGVLVNGVQLKRRNLKQWESFWGG